jgi:cadmium resistance protein CadD (predicted permease)
MLRHPLTGESERESMLATLALAIVLFASTNVDDIFVLVGFFADARFRVREIVVGQYLGITVLVGVSVAASLFSLFLPRSYIGLLGIVPITVGAKSFFDLTRARFHSPEPARADFPKGRHKHAAVVALVTIANGGDNIGMYTPAFVIRSRNEIAVIVFVFAIMTGVWCLLALWIVNHPRLGAPIRRYGRIVASAVLIALGVMVMIQAGTFGLLQNLLRAVGV